MAAGSDVSSRSSVLSSPNFSALVSRPSFSICRPRPAAQLEHVQSRPHAPDCSMASGAHATDQVLALVSGAGLSAGRGADQLWTGLR